MEVDYESGMHEAVKLTVGAWNHYKKLDYEQFPFKCRSFHEYWHFQRNYRKAQAVDKEIVEGWKQAKKSKTATKQKEKKNPMPKATPPNPPKVTGRK